MAEFVVAPAPPHGIRVASQRTPEAARLDIVDVLHGHEVADPYRWLEDPDDARTVAWSQAQDEHYAAALASWDRRDGFHARLTELYGVGDVGVPVWRGRRSFALRRDPGQDHAVLAVTEPDGTERVLIDPMAIDPLGTTTLDFSVPSPDGKLLAYGLSEGGTETSVIRVMDVTSLEIVDTPIDRVRYTPIAWRPGSDGFYFVRSLPEGSVPDDDAMIHRRVYLHLIGREADELIFGEGAERATYFGVGLSEDGRWLTITVSRGTDARNEVWLADLTAGSGPVAVQRDVDALTSLSVGRDGIAYILTNRDAPRWRLCVANPRDLVAGAGYGGWRTLLPEDPTAVLTDYSLLDGAELANHLVVAHRTRHAVSEMSIHEAATGTPIHDLPLPGTGTVGAVTTRRGGGHEAWLSYTDFTTPERVLRYDATTGIVDVWAEPSGAVATSVEIETRHVTYPSYDGTEIHMFVLSAATAEPGHRPTILYGYGGFGISMGPAYGPTILAWIEAGGVYAIACLRGGGEEGEEWHRAGMRESKQNVFDDLHAAADFLVESGTTTYAQLGIYGGSNGGLLVGVAVTQHPEKYAAVVCSAPLLDMVRYELFGLGANWSGEFGSAAIAEEFGWLRAYSPYHNVIDGTAYPAVVFTVFEGDTRVDPLHARKLCAALQHATGAAAPIVIRRERNVGHGSRAVSKMADLTADRLAFFAAML
jgi:prolyl oligopeptidase